MTSIRCLALAVALALPAANAGAADTAAGHYRMGDQRFDMKAGVAIRLWQDAERETFGVVLGEGPFDPKAAVGALDPLDAIAASAPDDSGMVLLWIRPGFDGPLEFGSVLARPGSFNTNGDGNEKVKVEGGRIRGEWIKPSTEFTDKTWEMTVRFDLPLTAIADPGTPLPADGGAPGKAYRAFLDALAKKDRDKVMAMQGMPADMVEILGADSVLEILAMNHPSSEGEVLGGWIDGDRAQLRVRGKHDFGQTVRGRVEMKNDGGTWKVGDGAVR
jgi:hypothetical protein